VTTVRAYVDAAAALFMRDARLYLSYRARFVTQTLSGFLGLVLFYYVSRLVTVGAFGSPDTYFAYVVVGLAVFEVMTASLGIIPAALRQELVAGTFERVVLSPFGPVCAVLSMLIFPFFVAFLQAVLTLMVAVLVFDMPFEWQSAPLAVPVALVGALAFVPFAFLLAATVLTVKQALGGTALIVTGISLTSGFFFPVALLPDWIEWTSEAQPFTPTLEVLRDLLIGFEADGSAWTAVVKLAIFIAVLLPVAVWTLGASIRFAQRRGTIIEY
jgi:ABC-2 type transport system permease protein